MKISAEDVDITVLKFWEDAGIKAIFSLILPYNDTFSALSVFVTSSFLYKKREHLDGSIIKNVQPKVCLQI